MRCASRRRCETTSPTAARTPEARGTDHPLDPELLGDLDRVQRAGATKGKQCVATGVDPALDSDHAQGADHLGARDRGEFPRRSQAPPCRARRRAWRRPARRRRGRARPRRPAAPWGRDSRGAGWRRLRSARCHRVRSRPGRGRHRPIEGRRAAPRLRRARRSSRRRPPPCARRASAAPGDDRRSRLSSVPGPSRHRRRTHRTRSRPCRSRARSPRPPARATYAAPAAPPAGPERTVQAACPAAASRSMSPPLDCMIPGLGRRSPPRVRIAGADSWPAGGRGRRRSRWSPLARTRETFPPPRATGRRAGRAALRPGHRRVRARAPGGGRSAGGPPPRPRPRPPRSWEISSLTARSRSGLSRPSGPIRSAAAKRSSSGTSASGRPAHRR